VTICVLLQYYTMCFCVKVIPNCQFRTNQLFIHKLAGPSVTLAGPSVTLAGPSVILAGPTETT